MLKSKTFLKKTRAGGVVKIVREHYLRDDIGCGAPACAACDGAHATPALESQPGDQASSLCPWPHYLLPDTNVLLHQVRGATGRVVTRGRGGLGNRGRRVSGWRGRYHRRPRFQLSRPRYISLTLFFYLFPFFFGSWSCSFRHVNFLTPGVSSTLDYKCLEAGDLGFCGLQIATPRQLVSAYEQKLCGPADLFVNSFSTANFCGPFAGALLKPARQSDCCHLFYGKVTLWPDGEPVY